MSDVRISELTALTSPAVGDVLPVVDISDTAQAESGSTRKITKANLTRLTTDTTTNLTGVLVGGGSNISAYAIDTDLSSVSGSDDTIPSAKATKTYADSHLFTWQGPWATSTVYAVNDIVENDGSGYVCTTAHTAGSTSEPGVGMSWTTYWDLMVQEGVAATNTHMVSAYLNQAQDNVADATDTKVLLNGQANDPGSNFSGGSSRYTVPETGYYTVLGSVGFANVIADKQYQAMIYVNGVAKAFSIQVPAAALAIRVPVAKMVYAVAGQFIELYCRQNSGASTPDLIATEASTFMTITFEGPG